MAETIRLFSKMFPLLPGHIARLPFPDSLAVRFGHVTEFQPIKCEKMYVPLLEPVHKLSPALLHALFPFSLAGIEMISRVNLEFTC